MSAYPPCGNLQPHPAHEWRSAGETRTPNAWCHGGQASTHAVQTGQECCDVHAMVPEAGHHENCPECPCVCGKKKRDHGGMWCSEQAVLKSDVRKLSEKAYHRIKALETALLTIIEGVPTARTPNGYQCQNCGVVDGHNKVCYAGIAIAVMEKRKRL